MSSSTTHADLEHKGAESQDVALIVIILLILMAFLLRHLASFRKSGMRVSRASGGASAGETTAEEDEGEGEEEEEEEPEGNEDKRD